MRPAQCHPERRHCAFGLCKSCYMKQRYYDSVHGPKIRAQTRDTNAEILADPVLREARRIRMREWHKTRKTHS